MSITDHVNIVIDAGDFNSFDTEVAYDGRPYYVVVEPTSYLVAEGSSFEFDVLLYRNVHEESSQSVQDQVIPTVTYTVSGTASNGVDYTLLDGTVPFNPASTFYDMGKDRRGHIHTIEVDAFNDVPFDDLETIIVTINSSDDYIIGDPAQITANMTPGTFTTVIDDLTTPEYATLNPSDKHSSITLSNGNLTATADTTDGGGNTRLVRTNIEKTTEKWYFEATVNSGNYGGAGVGINSSSMNVTGGGTGPSFTHIYEESDSGILNAYDDGNGGANPYNGTVSGNGGATVSFALDLDNNQLTLKNASTGNTIISGLGIGSSDNMPLATFRNFFAGQITFNFGATAFTGTVPSGFHIGYGNNLPIA